MAYDAQGHKLTTYRGERGYWQEDEEEPYFVRAKAVSGTSSGSTASKVAAALDGVENPTYEQVLAARQQVAPGFAPPKATPKASTSARVLGAAPPATSAPAFPTLKYVPPQSINRGEEDEHIPAKWIDIGTGKETTLKTFDMPTVDSGYDNKYDVLNSLVANGAAYADGTKVKADDKAWGKTVFLPENFDLGKIAKPFDQNPKEDDGFLGMGGFGDVLLIAGLALTGVGLAGYGPLAGAFGSGATAAGGAAAAGAAASDAAITAGLTSTIGGASGLGATAGAIAGGAADLIAFETAAATVPSSAPGILSGVAGTALKGAAKSAIVSGGVQLATTGKIDLKKTLISAAAGGFGSVLGEYVGETLDFGKTAGQIAGAVGGAAVGAALTPDSRVAGAVSGAANSVPVPGDNPAGLSFSAPGIINARAPRTTDWKTPRLDWAGTGAA